MSDPISKELIIHLERAVDLVHSTADTHHIEPKSCRFLIGQISWFDNMPPAPDNNNIPTLNTVKVQIAISRRAGVEANAWAVLIRSPFSTHDAACTGNLFLIIVWPRTQENCSYADNV